MTKKEGNDAIDHVNVSSAKSNKKKVMSKAELEEALLNNFVNLQKVLTNLSIKFDELSDNISKFLQLFEISAKSFSEKYSGGSIGNDNELLGKLDSLLDQNKTIAKGIMLMEEKIRLRNATAQEEQRISSPQPVSPTVSRPISPPVQQTKENPNSAFEGMMKSKSIQEY
jgi:hypothetical protein